MPFPPLLQFDLNDKTTQWVVLCGALLGLIYVLMRPKGRKRGQGHAPAGPQGPRFSLAQQRQVEQQMQNLLVEFAQMARQMSAQLDTRAAKLEELLKEADEKLSLLRAAAGAAGDVAHRSEEASDHDSGQDGQAGGRHPTPQQEEPESDPEDGDGLKSELTQNSAENSPSKATKESDAGPPAETPIMAAVIEPKSTVPTRGPKSRRKGADAQTSRLAADARHSDVYALADEGRSSEDIARRLHRPRGEVELILALRPK